MSGAGMAMSEAKSGVGHERPDESFSSTLASPMPMSYQLTPWGEPTSSPS
jgi:hypothetical protein